MLPANASPGEVASPVSDPWTRIETQLKARLRADVFERWFAPLRLSRLEADTLEVSAPDRFHRDFVDDNYGPFFQEFVAGPLGRKVAVRFVVDAGLSAPRAVELTAAALPLAERQAAEAVRDGRPNLRYTFDTFVVGESNRFAFAAAGAVAAKPGKNYNPLFLHGDSGLGKTHLLHAIAHEIIASRPGARVAIVSSERYTNEFVEALSRGPGSMSDFRKKYRECDAFLVDDVQFLAGKDKTAEEFFHTFNALYEHEVQIVLSSDRSPKELKGLEDRLCSRFEWGVRVEVNVPEFETRSAILRKKAQVERITLPEEVASLLATHIKSNVRELEGALMRVAAFASLKQEPLSESLARNVLGDVIPPPGYKPSIERIQEEVSKYYALTVAKLTSPNREQKIALPRQVAMYLCRELAGETLQQIADKFNKKDHTTVMAAEKRVRDLIESDSEVAEAVRALTAKLLP